MRFLRCQARMMHHFKPSKSIGGTLEIVNIWGDQAFILFYFSKTHLNLSPQNFFPKLKPAKSYFFIAKPYFLILIL